MAPLAAMLKIKVVVETGKSEFWFRPTRLVRRQEIQPGCTLVPRLEQLLEERQNGYFFSAFTVPAHKGVLIKIELMFWRLKKLHWRVKV